LEEALVVGQALEPPPSASVFVLLY
jgi:hypothetical protein